MTIGHNTVAAQQLKSIIERIEHLEEEKSGLANDIKEVYAEAKGNGLSVPTIRTIIRLRKKDVEQREEEQTILETYMAAIGMIQPDLFDEAV